LKKNEASTLELYIERNFVIHVGHAVLLR